MSLLNGLINLFSGLGAAEGLLKPISTIFNMNMAKKQYKLAEQANTANIEAQKRANDTNIMLTRETNAQQMELAEKEYQRSLPTTQVANYMQAGMSRAGAIGALSGAGSYSAPSLNTAQVNAEQSDVSGQTAALEQMIGVAANAMQMRQEAKLAREQMQNAKEIAEIQAESAQNVAEINERASVYASDKGYSGQDLVSSRRLYADLAHIGIEGAKLQEMQRQFNIMSPYQIKELEAQIAHLQAQTDLDIERKKEIADKLIEWNSSEQKDARKAQALLVALTNQHDLDKLKFECESWERQYIDKGSKSGYNERILFTKEYSEMGQRGWNAAYNVLGGEVLSSIVRIYLGKYF